MLGGGFRMAISFAELDWSYFIKKKETGYYNVLIPKNIQKAQGCFQAQEALVELHKSRWFRVRTSHV